MSQHVSLVTRTPTFRVGSKVTELTGDIPIGNSATKLNSSVSRITQPRVSSDCQPIDEGSNAYLLFAESQVTLPPAISCPGMMATSFTTPPRGK